MCLVKVLLHSAESALLQGAAVTGCGVCKSLFAPTLLAPMEHACLRGKGA